MGNQTSHGSTRLILPDGTVQEYKEPITVAELMFDHPQQAVVELQLHGNKTKPLAADVMLEKNKVYLLVPMRRGKLVCKMSAEEARRILLRASAGLKSGSFVTGYTGFIPVFARMCPATVVVKSKKKVKEVEKSSVVKLKPELFPAGEDGYFLTRQSSIKSSWKPSLDTIIEKCGKDKIRHWLL